MKTSRDFFNSILCLSKKHCALCRGSQKWRDAVALAFGLDANFACPNNVSSDITENKVQHNYRGIHYGKCLHFGPFVKYIQKKCCGGKVKSISINHCVKLGKEIASDFCFWCNLFEEKE